MKHLVQYLLSGMLAVCLFPKASALCAEDPSVARKAGDSLVLVLTLDAGTELTSNDRLILTPVVTAGDRNVRMSPVVFTGRIREKVDARRERLYGTPAVPADAYRYVVVGRDRKDRSEHSVLYEGAIPYESWMAGGRVVLYRDWSGCGLSESLPPLTVARIADPVRPRLTFLIPQGDSPKHESEQITVVLHFPQGRSVLLRGFGDNRRQLARIDSLTARLLGSDSLTLESIYLKGFASPEDTYTFNTRLSANRVQALRRYLTEQFDLDGAEFITETEPEDWDSLRCWLVASDLPARDDVLAVIDTVPDPDARDAEIRRIDGGKTYLLLLDRVYPQLRRVDYRINYFLPTFTLAQTRELVATHPELLSAGEFCRLAESYPPASQERASVCAQALEYYPDDPCVCNNMAMSALIRGDVQTARRCLDRCADDPRVQNNLGVVCLADGDRTGARRCFASAAREGSAEAAYNLAHFDALSYMPTQIYD